MKVFNMLLMTAVMLGVFICGVWAGGMAVDEQRDAEMDAAAEAVANANETCVEHWSM